MTKLWFKHDYDALEDERLFALVAEYHSEGYAVFFHTLEIMYKTGVPIGRLMVKRIACDLGMTVERAEEILNYASSDECGNLFEKVEEGYSSKRVVEEQTKKSQLSDKMRKLGQASAEQRATARQQDVNDSSTIRQRAVGVSPTDIEKEIDIDKENIIEVSNDTSLSSPTEDDGVNLPSVPRETVDYQGVVAMYNAICTSFPRVTKLSDGRKKAIRARVNYGYTMDDFKKVFESAQSSSFLKGNNKRNWSATFDWMINGENMAKVLDGNFNDKTPSDESQVRTNEVPVRKKDLSDITDEELEESKKVSWV